MEIRLEKSLREVLLTRPEIGALIGLIALSVVFTALNPAFMTISTMASVISVASELGVITAGVTLLMISGEFNLAVSSLYILTPVTTMFLINDGVPTAAAFVLSMLLAAAIGALMGYIVVKTRLHSFIVTLGFMMFLRGLALYITGGFPMEYQGDPAYLYALNGRLIGDFRVSALWFIGVLVVFVVLLEFTRYGNWCFAAGGNPRVAHQVGVHVGFVKILNFVVSSVLAGLAGCFSMARLGGVDPSLGYGIELETIVAAVIGGTSLFGGYGSIVGAALGAIVLSMIRVGLVLAGAPPYWYKAFIGPILVVAAITNYAIMRKMLRGRR